MHHSFLDRYSNGNSFFHRLDPRTKLLSTVLYVVAVVLTPPGHSAALVSYVLLLSAIIALSGVPVVYIFKRSVAVVPFVLLICLSASYFNRYPVSWLIAMSSKAVLATAAMVELSSTTRFADLLQALKKLRTPPLFIILLSFMYRYIYILVDERMRMERARQSRSFSHRGRLKTFAHMIGSLFLRGFERGERIYGGMLSRGFDGELRSITRIHYSLRDAIYFGLFVTAIILIHVGTS